MMIHTTILSHLVLPMVLCVALGPTVDSAPMLQKDSTEQWKILDDKAYEIQYPSAWELDQTGVRGTSFVLFAPLESEIDSFRENVGLTIQDLTKYDLNLDQYTELSEGQVKTIFPHSRILESERIQDHSGEYHRLMYLGDSDVFQLTFVQHYWVRDNHAYVLTFVAEQANYELYKETGEQVMKTFRLK